MYNKCVHKQQVAHTARGFSLIELLVTVSIVTLVTGLALVRYSSFNSTVLLNSQAYEIALDIRQTQLYSLSVGAVSGGSNFRDPYGIEFRTSSNNNTEYRIFQDTNNNTLGDSGEIFQNILLGRNFTITSLCLYTDPNLDCTINQIEVLFERPDFVARFTDGSNPVSASYAIVTVVDDMTGRTRDIRIDASGYVTVE